MDSTWDSVSVLDAAGDILRAPLDEVLPRLSGALAGLIPHRAAAELATECAHSPFKTAGEAALAERITAAELDRLGPVVGVGRTWQGTAMIGGAEHPVLALHSDRTTRGGAARPGARAGRAARHGRDRHRARPVGPGHQHLDRLAAEAVPGTLAQSRAAAGGAGRGPSRRRARRTPPY